MKVDAKGTPVTMTLALKMIGLFTAGFSRLALWRVASFFGATIAVLIFTGSTFLANQWRHAESPYGNLRSFATREVVAKDLSSLGDLKVDELDLYAQAACAAGSSVSDVRFAIKAQLSRIPKEVREDLIQKAIIDRMTMTSSSQNTKASVSKNGKAHSYLAFWSTAYNGETSPLSPKYTTCLMLSGVELSLAEDVAEYEETTANRQIGTKPCECGWVTCERCPIFEEHTTRTPIFKRHSLTMKQQVDLHRWMAKQATDRAMALVGNRETITSEKIQQQLGSLSWRLPKDYVFLGNDVSSKKTAGDKRAIHHTEL